MEFEDNIEFKLYVVELLAKYKGKRIHRFHYQGKLFWLKQPDQLKGIWRIIKSNPQKALQNEIQQLQILLGQNIPVPKLALFGDDFFVLEDMGCSINLCIENTAISESLKQIILNDCAKGLAELHKKGFIHGRPALRDILWQDGKITFIDFEEYFNHKKSLSWQKIRDCLIFVHSLFRAQVITVEQEYKVILHFQQYCDVEIWQGLLAFLARYRWLYYMSLPFKPIARTDLIAFYKLFEHTLLRLKK